MPQKSFLANYIFNNWNWVFEKMLLSFTGWQLLIKLLVTTGVYAGSKKIEIIDM
jgi:hypothetical protein